MPRHLETMTIYLLTGQVSWISAVKVFEAAEQGDKVALAIDDYIGQRNVAWSKMKTNWTKAQAIKRMFERK